MQKKANYKQLTSIVGTKLIKLSCFQLILSIRDQLKKQATSRQHPAWQLYLETLDLLRTFRPVQDSAYYASRVFRREENKPAKIKKGVVII